MSGVGHLVGLLSGQVLAIEVRQKGCRTCEVAARLGKKPPPHSCRLNWTGSAKGMEGSIFVETVKKVNSSDAMVRVSVLVGDDDSSAISQVRREVDPSIQKWSDVNHAKKGLGNRLFELKKSHKELSETVIKSAQKNFAYALNQNSADPDSLNKAFEAVPMHM